MEHNGFNLVFVFSAKKFVSYAQITIVTHFVPLLVNCITKSIIQMFDRTGC